MDCSQWLLNIHYYQSNRDPKAVDPKRTNTSPEGWHWWEEKAEVLAPEEDDAASGRGFSHSSDRTSQTGHRVRISQLFSHHFCVFVMQ